MRRFIDSWSQFVVKRRWLVVALIALITVISLFGFRKLYFYNKFTSWLAPDDKVLSLFIKTSEKFSTNELVMVLVKPKDGVFEQKTLEQVHAFTEMMKSRKEVFVVTSLSNIADIKKIEGGIEVKNLLDEIPSTAAELEELRNYVFSKENYKDNVVSGNGEWLGISVFISNQYDSEKVVKSLLIPQAEKFFGDEAGLYYTGIPSDAHYINQYAIDDLKLLTPLIFIIIGVILFLSFKTLKGVAFPSLVVLISTIWLFGLIGYLGAPMTFITTAIPVLLTALGSAYGIHVVNKYNHDLGGAIGDKSQLLAQSTSAIFIPVMLAGVTTFVGFLSFRSAKLNLLADFGLFAAIGIVLALLIALTLIPALSVNADFKPGQGSTSTILAPLLKRTAKLVIHHKYLVAALALVVLAAFGWGIPNIKREINFTEFFPDDSLPKNAHDIAEDEFNGAFPVIFYLDSENAKGPDMLRVMRRCENYLLSIPELSPPVSIASMVQELNYQLNDRYAVPARPGSVGNLWFFLEGRDELKQLLTADNREAVVFSRSPESATSFNKYLSGKLDAFLDSDVKHGTQLYAYDLKAAGSGAARTAILKKEAGYLAHEIAWVASHYMGQDIGTERVQPLLERFLEEAESADSTLVAQRQKEVVQKSVTSDSFDFFIEAETQRKLASGLLRLLDNNSFDAASVVDTLKRFVPEEEYDEEIARSVADSLLFKIREARQDVLVQQCWQALHVQLDVNGRQEDFRKRAQSILYDLLDNLAVLPYAEVGGVSGAELGIARLAQSGSPSLLTRLDHFLYTSQIQSLILAYALTLILMIIMRQSLLLGLISTIPIVFTISVIYGFLGHFGINLDYATMMTGGVSIGVGIDYAIHFVHGLIKNTDRGLTMEAAVEATLVEKGTAILSNAVAVMAGFAVLLLSSMMILRNFGATMIGSMFLAAVSALTVLPAVLLICKPMLNHKFGGKK